MEFVPAAVQRAGTNFTKPCTSLIFGLCRASGGNTTANWLYCNFMFDNYSLDGNAAAKKLKN